MYVLFSQLWDLFICHDLSENSDHSILSCVPTHYPLPCFIFSSENVSHLQCILLICHCLLEHSSLHSFCHPQLLCFTAASPSTYNSHGAWKNAILKQRDGCMKIRFQKEVGTLIISPLYIMCVWVFFFLSFLFILSHIQTALNLVRTMCRALWIGQGSLNWADL